MACSAVLLTPNVANILLLNFCEQIFVQHGSITIAIGCNGLSLLIFEEKWPNNGSGPKSTPNSDSFWMCRLFNVCVRVVCVPNATILLVYIPAKSKMGFIWKDVFFFAKIGIFCKSIAGRSIGFNFWTNWTLYGVIPMSPKCSIVENDALNGQLASSPEPNERSCIASLCKIRLNDVSEMFNCWERR